MIGDGESVMRTWSATIRLYVGKWRFLQLCVHTRSQSTSGRLQEYLRAANVSQLSILQELCGHCQ